MTDNMRYLDDHDQVENSHCAPYTVIFGAPYHYVQTTFSDDIS